MATPVLTALAMLAFAANSILCRLALQAALIDAASFTTIRALSGALVLAVIVWRRHEWRKPARTDWIPALMLFAYMACFSFAYISLSAGTGALILFGTVQVTMIAFGIFRGEAVSAAFWTGFGLAIAGLVWLVFPGLTAPNPLGAALMAGAGLAWGIYSLLGRRSTNATSSTAGNFVLATPMALILSLVTLRAADVAWQGAALAAASGALTSGLGYIVWYAVVPKLSRVRAATVQLTVPVIAATLGVVLLAEPVTWRLFLASVAILGGVGIVVAGRGATGGRPDNRKKPA